MINENIYQHFKPEERNFIERCFDWLNRVEDDYAIITTPFLNPRECYVLKNLIGQREIKFFSTEDIGTEELHKVILAPLFYDLELSDFDVALLEIKYASKFNSIRHAQVLGAFLNQSGVRRQELGDIVIADQKVQVFVSRHLVELFVSIEKISNVSVQIKEVSFSKLEIAVDNSIHEVILVENLRIDKIIAASFNVSRNLATNMLESNKVKLNYLEIEKKDFSVTINDLISVRGFGRIKIIDLLGLTKKGKQKVSVIIIKNKK